METILVPLDFSDATEKVVSAAGKFAEFLKVRLVLLHVVEPRDAYSPLEATDILAVPPSATQPESTHASIEKLEQLAKPLRQRHHLTVICKVRTGFGVDEILAQARAFDCSMIILGSHGHGALYEFFQGGVVTGVIKKAQIPVLVIPVREYTIRKERHTKSPDALQH